MRISVLSALLTVSALLLTSCAAVEDDEAADEGTASGPAADHPEELAAFYEQDPTWEECEGDLECTTVEVPMDYSDPEGETLEIALVSAAPEESGGSPDDDADAGEDEDGDDDVEFLLTNPGGPGESGYDLVAEMRGYAFSSRLQENFALVGFDPRGVHRSAPVQCFTDEEMDSYREGDDAFDEDTDTPTGEMDAARQQAREIGEDCLERTGDSLEFVDTDSAARDMDVIRAALGQERLHYLGFSYGTHLGITYAELFGDRVGRFVLDGMMDTSVDLQEISLAQARGFDSVLDDFAQWCEDLEDCAVDGDADDIIGSVEQMLHDVHLEPVEMSGDRTLTVEMLISGFILPMYSSEGWPLLAQALGAAVDDGEYDMFLAWSDAAAGREADGSYSWQGTMARQAIMCADYPVPEADGEIRREFDAIAREAPVLGPYLGHPAIMCDEWPIEPRDEPEEPELDDVDEILFVGTSGDPATPVEWAESMHEMVPASSLLIYEGEGHTAYRAEGGCATEAMDDFLVDGELFDGRSECS
ncbi:MAG: alpha/beta hydrolase [Nesterenkonia sp.]|nr:alpha/beta hydrolase [Nesterenkonia sp.]